MFQPGWESCHTLVTLEFLVAHIASKDFITTIPREGHSDVLPCCLTDIVGGHCRGIAKGLVEMPHEARQDIERRWLYDHLMMIRSKILGHHTRIFKLRVCSFLEADRKGLH